MFNKGFVDFAIKIYRKNSHPKFPDGGLMSQHLENLKPGEKVFVKGPIGKMIYLGLGEFRIPGRANVKKTKLGCVAGGTGITPVF